MRALIDACALQVEIMATGRKLRPIPPELQAHTKAQMNGRLGNAPRDDISWDYWLRLARAARSVVRGLAHRPVPVA